MPTTVTLQLNLFQVPSCSLIEMLLATLESNPYRLGALASEYIIAVPDILICVRMRKVCTDGNN